MTCEFPRVRMRLNNPASVTGPSAFCSFFYCVVLHQLNTSTPNYGAKGFGGWKTVSKSSLGWNFWTEKAASHWRSPHSPLCEDVRAGVSDLGKVLSGCHGTVVTGYQLWSPLLSIPCRPLYCEEIMPLSDERVDLGITRIDSYNLLYLNFIQWNVTGFVCDFVYQRITGNSSHYSRPWPIVITIQIHAIKNSI